MSAEQFDVWGRVRANRLSVADEVERLSDEQLDAPSWCPGWRVRDVIGHLVHLAEATQWSMARDLVRNGMRPDPALAKIARALGDLPVAALTTRLRAAAGGRFHVLGSPAPVALGEVLVHGADALRSAGTTAEVMASDVQPVLDVYRRIGRLAFHARTPKGVRLVADDLDWSAGDGAEVRGQAIDLLLLLANRRQVIPQLHGPGVALLGSA